MQNKKLRVRWLSIVMLVFPAALTLGACWRLTPDLRASDAVISPSPTQTDAPPTPSPQPSVSWTPSVTPEVAYLVEAGDSLLAIAERFGLTIEALLAANPGVNPAGLIYPGDRLLIPAPDAPLPTPEATPWPSNAQVMASAGGLRLRAGPRDEESVVLILSALTPLRVLGRTTDNRWLLVKTPYEDQGWLQFEFVDLFIELEAIPVVFGPAVTAFAAGEDPDLSATPLPTAPPEAYRYVSGIGEQARLIFERGLQRGNRPDVFSKIGDSITVSAAFLNPVGIGQYDLATHGYLQPVIDYYGRSLARSHNSFANASLAAGVGWSARVLVTPGEGDPAWCRADETPLDCEFRWVRPSVAIVMLGTNNLPNASVASFEDAMQEVIEAILAYDVVPIISTIPLLQREGMALKVADYNRTLADLADEYGVPLLDYGAALNGLFNAGLGGDGVHPSVAPAGHNADFHSEYLLYGMPVRNLTALQALDALWRQVIDPLLAQSGVG